MDSLFPSLSLAAGLRQFAGRLASRSRIATTRLLGAVAAVGGLLCAPRWAGSHAAYEVVACSGLALVLAGVAGRLWCTLYLGGRKTEQLVTDGPYAICRNPLYLFSFLAMAGIMASTGMLTFLVAAVLIFGLGYRAVILAEEKVLAERHGGAFASYCARVPRFWPRLASVSEPERREVAPRLFRRALRDGAWFAFVWAAVHVVHELHAAGQIPAVWQVW